MTDPNILKADTLNGAQTNPIRPEPSQTESDRVRPSLTEPDPVRLPNWVTLEDVEKQFIDAGIPRTRVLLARYCRQKRLRGIKDAGPNGDEWYVDPESVPRAIAELKRISRDKPTQTESDSVRLSQTEANRPEPTASSKKPINSDNDREDPNPNRPRPTQTESDSVRPGSTGFDQDISNHPLVKYLQKDADHWREEYKNQVRVTQQTQERAFEKIVELQRMVQVGQSRTLADFFLNAKNWVLGAGNDIDDTIDAEAHIDPSIRKRKKKEDNDA